MPGWYSICRKLSGDATLRADRLLRIFSCDIPHIAVSETQRRQREFLRPLAALIFFTLTRPAGRLRGIIAEKRKEKTP